MYNNEIFVATKNITPFPDSELNAEKLPLTLASSTDKPSIVTEKPADAQQLLTQASVAEELERPSHESTKTLLTVAAIGSAIIYYFTSEPHLTPVSLALEVANQNTTLAV